MGTKACPNDPVPPVIKIEEFSNTNKIKSKIFCNLKINILQNLQNVFHPQKFI